MFSTTSNFIKTWFHLRKLKKKLDPIALAISADITSAYFPERKEYLHYYKFPDGNFVTLAVRKDHFNVFTPNWNPGFEKQTDGLEIFLKAIEKTRLSVNDVNK